MICSIDIWALIFSVIASFVIMYVWYSDKGFGKTWRALKGIVVAEPMNSKMMFKASGIQLILILITNIILARLMFMTSSTTWVTAIMLAVWIWVGFYLTSAISAYIWDKKSKKLLAIDYGVSLVTLVVSALILGAF